VLTVQTEHCYRFEDRWSEHCRLLLVLDLSSKHIGLEKSRLYLLVTLSVFDRHLFLRRSLKKLGWDLHLH
jgi:hypothetical protein